MLSSSLTKGITPKRQKQALGFFALVMVYSLLGFFAAPSVTKKLMQDYVAQTLKLELSLTHIEINPLQLALRLDGLQIRDRQHKTLIAAKSIYINAGFWTSLWQRRIDIDELDLQQPIVNAHLNKAGELNLLQLLPPEDNEQSTTPWQLSLLAVHQAKIAIVDESRRVPFIKQLNDFSLSLYNLSSQTADKGNYQFSAQTAQGERLSWQGTVALKPMRSQGHFLIDHLQVITPASYLAELLPVNIQQGELQISGDYQLSLPDSKPIFSLANGHIVMSHITAATKTTKPLFYDIAKMELQNLTLQSPDMQARFKQLFIEELQLSERTNQPPLIELQQLTLHDGLWQQQNDMASLRQLDLAQLMVSDQQKSLINLPKIKVEHLSLKPEKHYIDTGRIIVNGGETSLQLLANEATNWQQAIANLMPRLSPPITTAVVREKSWTYALGELQVAQFVVNAEDQRQKPSIKEPVIIHQLTVNPELDLTRPHILAADMSLGTGGKIKLKGQLQESPLVIDSQIKLERLALPPLAAYLNKIARLHLESGDVDIDGHMHLQQKPKLQITYDGNLAVNQFAANDLKLNERFLAWQHLAAQGVEWQLEPMQIHIRQVLAEQPFTRVIIAPDKSINLEQVVVADDVQNTAPSQPEAGKVPLLIDKINVINGSMLFADLTIKPQFATGIQSLTGEIRDISTLPTSYAKIALTGRVDQYGKAIINGALNPFGPDKNTKISVKFQNIELTTLTPYSAKFAGYRIDKGKLSLDLDYKIQNRQLTSTNKIVLSQLTLGEKVDSPDAVSLPLRLAIALLKDINGVIDLDIPLTGSLDDPKFRVAPIVWQAIVTVVTKVATAPFRFIANLVGGGDDMDSIAFSAGNSTLAADNEAKLAKIAEALTKRPNLRLELRGSFDQDIDVQAIKQAKFNQLLNARLAQNGNELKVLELLYSEKLGQEALKQQRALSLKPTTETTTNKDALQLSNNTYSQALRNALIAAQEIQEGDLRQLALDRARMMRVQLVEKNAIEEGRVFILEPEQVQSTDHQLVISKVSVNGG